MTIAINLFTVGPGARNPPSQPARGERSSVADDKDADSDTVCVTIIPANIIAFAMFITMLRISEDDDNDNDDDYFFADACSPSTAGGE